MRGCVSCSRCVCPCSKLVCACVAAGVLDKPPEACAGKRRASKTDLVLFLVC